MKENRPDSSFFSADSKRKQGPRRRSFANAEIGVSTSAMRSATIGTTVLRFASDRNSSIEGVTDVACTAVYCSGSLWPMHFVFPRRKGIITACASDLSRDYFYPFNAGVAQW